jgi:hypothetical protein
MTSEQTASTKGSAWTVKVQMAVSDDDISRVERSIWLLYGRTLDLADVALSG